jgi:hypothetical protein
MRFQTCVFVKDGSMRSEVVRARNTQEALRKMMATKDIAYAPRAYAHPLRLTRPEKHHWRWNLYCSVNGKVIMSDQEPPEASLVTQASQ